MHQGGVFQHVAEESLHQNHLGMKPGNQHFQQSGIFSKSGEQLGSGSQHVALSPGELRFLQTHQRNAEWGPGIFILKTLSM